MFVGWLDGNTPEWDERKAKKGNFQFPRMPLIRLSAVNENRKIIRCDYHSILLNSKDDGANTFEVKRNDDGKCSQCVCDGATDKLHIERIVEPIEVGVIARTTKRTDGDVRLFSLSLCLFYFGSLFVPSCWKWKWCENNLITYVCVATLAPVHLMRCLTHRDVYIRFARRDTYLITLTMLTLKIILCELVAPASRSARSLNFKTHLISATWVHGQRQDRCWRLVDHFFLLSHSNFAETNDARAHSMNSSCYIHLDSIVMRFILDVEILVEHHLVVNWVERKWSARYRRLECADSQLVIENLVHGIMKNVSINK